MREHLANMIERAWGSTVKSSVTAFPSIYLPEASQGMMDGLIKS